MPTTDSILPKNAVCITRGTSKTFQITVTDGSNRAVDLTGSRVLFSVKQALADSRPLIQKDSNFGSQILITNPRCGIAQIYVTPADTQFLDPEDYLYDVWVVLTGGNRYAVIPTSIFQVQPGVTLIP